MQKNSELSLSTYRLLGSSGLRVSPFCLGTMTFGSEWGWGADKDTSRKMLERYLGLGGNFIDTANFYTNGTSETFLGEFLSGRRDRVVLATKFSLSMHRGDPNAGGNNRKNILLSLDESLRRLKTDYIDLYWLHAWDQITPVEEVMRTLDDVVTSGKVLYVGISDTPAWKVAQANTLCAFRGWAPFIGLQIEYSLIERTVERELIPMALDLGLGVTPWSPLGGGLLTGKYVAKDKRPSSNEAKRDLAKKLTDSNLAIAHRLNTVASRLGKSPAQVALRWLLEKPAVISPIIGARTVAQLDDNLDALSFSLPAEALQELNAMSEIDLGFPGRFLDGEFVRDAMTGGTKTIRC